MNTALKVLVAIVGIAMAFLLLIGVITLWGLINLSHSSASDIEDLAWVNLKIEKVMPKSTSTLLKAQGYPTIFSVSREAEGQPISSLIAPGDQISIRVKKEIARDLQDVTASYVYGLQLANGRKVLENARAIPTPFDWDFNFLVIFLVAPVVFFTLMFARRSWFWRSA